MENRKIKLTVEDKTLVLERYSDIEWCDDVTHMRCVSCQNVAILSYRFTCKHIFCRSCYSKDSRLCQRCGLSNMLQNASDAGETERKLCQLKVCCPNKKYGCRQVDELGNIVDHVRCCLHILYRDMSDEMRVMKSESEANWKQMQARMNEMEFKVNNNMAQLKTDLDVIKGNLDFQTKLTNSEMQHKGEDVEKMHMKMQDKMNEMETKVNNTTEQLIRDLTGLTADLQVHKDNLTRIESKEKDSDRKRMKKVKQLRDEVEMVKSEQTRMSLKAKEDVETIYTVKGKTDAFIQLLEKKDVKIKKRLNKQEINIKNMMDVHKEQMEDMKSSIASMDEEQKTNQIAMGLLESSINELSKGLHEQHEQLITIEQHGRDVDERNSEVEQVTTLNQTEMAQKQLEEVKTHQDNDKLQLKIDNQMKIITNQLAAVDSRITTNSNKWEDIDNKMTTICNKVATIDNRVAINDERMTTTINSLTTTKNEVDAVVKIIADTNKKVDANNTRIKSTNKQVKSCHNRINANKKKLNVSNNRITATDNKLTAMNTKLKLMEVWLCNSTGKTSPNEYNDMIKAVQNKIKTFGKFGTLKEKDGRLVCKFTWMVDNIEEKIAKKVRLESEPFYTNVPGYKVKLSLEPNDSKSKHLEVYLCLVKGEFDDIVSWPFDCEYELYSVSRDGTRFASVSVDPSTETNCEDSFSRPNNEDHGYGTAQYIKLKTLLANKDQYLIDGCLIIKAIVWLTTERPAGILYR